MFRKQQNYLQGVIAMLILKEDWNFSLLEEGGQYEFSVVCGGAGIYEAKFLLSSLEVERFKSQGASYLKELADNVRLNSNKYTDRPVG